MPVKINNQYGANLPLNQFITFEDINKEQLNDLGNLTTNGKVNLIKKGSQLPRHGNAPPSVIRRNKDTINRKKAEKDR